MGISLTKVMTIQLNLITLDPCLRYPQIMNHSSIGGLGICDLAGAPNVSDYCEFERFFEDDVSRALNISYYRVQIMFIKQAALDAVLVYFRVLPAMRTRLFEPNVTASIANLVVQVHDYQSVLYKGNVTIRVDPMWGVSEMYVAARTQAAKFTLKYYEIDQSKLLNKQRMTLMTAYDRCKANRRCNWGIVGESASEYMYLYPYTCR
jgi:hypothetical protein